MGPTSSVVLPGSPEVHRTHVSALVSLVTSAVDGELFWVNGTLGIGGAYQGEPRPFCLGVDEAKEYESEELVEIERRFGLRPETDVSFGAMCNGPEDHKILCELSIAVAERSGGVIDFGGELTLPKSALEGHVEEIPYIGADGNKYVCHMGDSSFARAWLQCKYFHMVK